MKWVIVVVAMALSFYGGMSLMALMTMAGKDDDRMECNFCPYKVEPEE